VSDLHADLVSGQPGEALAALRALLADALVQVEPNERQQLSKEFRAVLEAQQSIAVPEASTSDDLAKQRQARRAAAQAAASA